LFFCCATLPCWGGPEMLSLALSLSRSLALSLSGAVFHSLALSLSHSLCVCVCVRPHVVAHKCSIDMYNNDVGMCVCSHVCAFAQVCVYTYVLSHKCVCSHACAFAQVCLFTRMCFCVRWHGVARVRTHAVKSIGALSFSLFAFACVGVVPVRVCLSMYMSFRVCL
jgi:hypothetical protein